MIEAVAGFLFSEDQTKVALIRKNKPAFHFGLWNAVGGKIEPGELPVDAMIREFEEETGVKIRCWDHFLTLTVPGWNVRFFRSRNDLVYKVKTVTDEEVNWHWVHHVKPSILNIVPNLAWMVPMALCQNVASADVVERHNV